MLEKILILFFLSIASSAIFKNQYSRQSAHFTYIQDQ